jgi:two-component system, chemotaxis family, chemotaxis protein CheY
MASHRDTKPLPTGVRPPPTASDVIVIDESKTCRTIYVQVVRSLGDQVQAHGFGRPTQALTWMRENTAALVMCNLWMAELDAFELLVFLRKQPIYANLPIMVVTSDNSEGLLERILGAGASDVLLIPTPFDEMRRRLRRLLGPSP